MSAPDLGAGGQLPTGRELPGAKTRLAVEPGSAIYRGRVMHQRLQPLRHRLDYRMFSLLLDIDELPALDARLRWFSLGRFNLFSFRPTDHGDGNARDASALRALIDARLAQAGLPTGGRIRLLTMPRLLGYAFNPLSVWFCDGPDGELQAMVYEVNNTFDQRHSYLIEVAPAQRQAAVVEQCSDKQLYVSPFLGMAMHYRFRIEPPREHLSIGVSVHEGSQQAPGACVLNARLDALRAPLTDAALLRLLVTHPLLTLKVLVGIHWEALRLWLKGARLHQRPEPPDRALTVIRHNDTT
ncbi:hypothetical protein SAMN05216359_102278 [Roseateles sp. YR242]|uniref:DUF1365 domain-containing protein n=1 Tax=Roseateles sp. YR242 TaxID=1855305 RepID=UPI0008C5C294|nr:DUF1365 domain-containing protein [Roseateles sp. YR242]SEK58153.1 hypothetical protein SAMN05216359_102278 [Roseateles sp. YR242]